MLDAPVVSAVDDRRRKTPFYPLPFVPRALSFYPLPSLPMTQRGLGGVERLCSPPLSIKQIPSKGSYSQFGIFKARAELFGG